MQTIIENKKQAPQAEDMLSKANLHAHDLIEKAINQSNAVIAKANSLAHELIEEANTQAEDLIERASVYNTDLKDSADESQIHLLNRAEANKNLIIKKAHLNEKNLLETAAEDAEDLDKSAKTLINNAAFQAKGIVNEADEQARELLSDANQTANELLNNADSKAKNLVREAALQAKELVRDAAIKARILVAESADQTNGLMREAALEAKDLVKEAATSFIETKLTFLDIAARELRSPVTSISLIVELAEKQLMKEVLTEKHLKQIRPPLNRLLRLLGYLIDMSRLERNLVILEPSPTDLSTLISLCVEEIKVEGNKNNIHFHGPEQKIEINLDSLRIHQVLANILDNAVKYGGDGPIEVSLLIKSGMAHVEIKDQGPGISEEQQKLLFASFFRGKTDETVVTSGLGLGLSLCQEIIKLHGGIIGVQSVVGKGSTFYFELPLKDNDYLH